VGALDDLESVNLGAVAPDRYRAGGGRRLDGNERDHRLQRIDWEPDRGFMLTFARLRSHIPGAAVDARRNHR
jgi:hypothetical protein